MSDVAHDGTVLIARLPAPALLRRLRRVTAGEIACRARQAACKWVDRVAAGAATPLRFAQGAAGLADPAAVAARLREDLPARFFPGATDPAVPAALQATVPGARRALVASAERLRRGRFHLLGYRDLQFGEPLDWALDPLTGRRATSEHWSRVDPLDATRVGDSKVVWELNRHQWLVTLAQAYRVTGRRAYLDTTGAHIDDWIARNPPGTGINWSSSLEVAFRIISWCWTLALLRDTEWLSADRCARMLPAIHAHARHVERYLSTYFSPNTHLTGEALGLFYAGVVFPEFRHAARWRRTGWRILVEESARQIAEDGTHVEQATCYHRYTVEIYLHFLILARRHGIAVPPEVSARVVRMLEYLLAIGDPAGTMPSMGDADGGWMLPLARRRHDDCRHVFAIGAVLFSREDFARAARGSVHEAFWLFGACAAARLARLGSRPAPQPASRVFPAGGCAVMRSGDGPTSRRLLIDVGAIGRDVTGAHGHADLLSLQCSAFGEPYLIDPGTFTYTPCPEWRNYFRTTAAHSTVVVDGRSQAEPAGVFSWRTRPRAALRSWYSTAECDFIDAHHDAYATRRDAVRHRRRVLFVKPRYWVVVDDLYGERLHDVELRYQFSPRPVEVEDDGWIAARGAADRGLRVKAFATASFDTEVRQGREQPPEGWASPSYGTRCPAPVLVYTLSARLPVRLVTLLVPCEPLSATPGHVRAFGAADGTIDGLEFCRSGEVVRIDEQNVAAEPPREEVAWRNIS